jgi:REP element-mobilizing transposase RayT
MRKLSEVNRPATVVREIFSPAIPFPGSAGTTGNSPQFQLRVKFGIAKVPQGRLNNPMSLVSSYFHCVFSTKERRPLITPELRERLWPFLGGIARQNKMKAIEVGGVADHVHILLSLPATMPVAKAMQLIKGGSSKWIHETFPDQRAFAWQEEYGAFSVSVSQLDKTIEYVRGQEAHHRKLTFQEEFLVLLKKHRVEYDERYLWK